jgi:hypothetical protein
MGEHPISSAMAGDEPIRVIFAHECSVIRRPAIAVQDGSRFVDTLRPARRSVDDRWGHQASFHPFGVALALLFRHFHDIDSQFSAAHRLPVPAAAKIRRTKTEV